MLLYNNFEDKNIKIQLIFSCSVPIPFDTITLHSINIYTYSLLFMQLVVQETKNLLRENDAIFVPLHANQ